MLPSEMVLFICNAYSFILSRRAELLNISPESWEIIKQIKDLKSVLPLMRNVFHVAASLSPLVVLVPKKPSIDGIRRDHLIAVRCFFWSVCQKFTPPCYTAWSGLGQ